MIRCFLEIISNIWRKYMNSTENTYLSSFTRIFCLLNHFCGFANSGSLSPVLALYLYIYNNVYTQGWTIYPFINFKYIKFDESKLQALLHIQVCSIHFLRIEHCSVMLPRAKLSSSVNLTLMWSLYNLLSIFQLCHLTWYINYCSIKKKWLPNLEAESNIYSLSFLG